MFSLVQNSEEAEFIYKFTNKNIDGLIPKLISNVSVIPKKKKKKRWIDYNKKKIIKINFCLTEGQRFLIMKS